VRVRKAVRLFVGKGDIAIVSVRKNDSLLRETGTAIA